MRPVILITSCSYHLDRNEKCRKTWLDTWGNLCDYRFVLGVGNTRRYDDELLVDVDDSYNGLPAKIQASHKWAMEQGYEPILKTDCDVYLHVARVLVHGLNKASYVGNFYYDSFAMGSCYWLDAQATEILVNAPLPYPGTPGGDDVWVGQVMAEAGVSRMHEPRYWIGENPNYDSCFSLHTSGPPKLDMAEIHRRMVE
jgi:hypothetical protein